MHYYKKCYKGFLQLSITFFEVLQNDKNDIRNSDEKKVIFFLNDIRNDSEGFKYKLKYNIM